MRPLGIPATEDKLLQLAVKRLMEAIYEQDFLACSYGYRPLVGARRAVDELRVKLQFGGYHQLVEADIKGFFDNLSHEWLMPILAERIDDEPFLRLLKKWLKAGVLDTDGQVLRPETGTPQGGIISPVLANVYLHYALDLWFESDNFPRTEFNVQKARESLDRIDEAQQNMTDAINEANLHADECKKPSCNRFGSRFARSVKVKKFSSLSFLTPNQTPIPAIDHFGLDQRNDYTEAVWGNTPHQLKWHSQGRTAASGSNRRAIAALSRI